jgi:hypothetical protein
VGGDATGLGGACAEPLDRIDSRHADGGPHRHDALRPADHDHTPDDEVAAHDHGRPHDDLDPHDDAGDDSDDDTDDYYGATDDNGPDRHDAHDDGGSRNDDDYGGAVGR